MREQEENPYFSGISEGIVPFHRNQMPYMNQGSISGQQILRRLKRKKIQVGEQAEDVLQDLRIRRPRKRERCRFFCLSWGPKTDEVKEAMAKNGHGTPSFLTAIRFLSSLKKEDEQYYVVMHRPLKSSDGASRFLCSYVVDGERWIDATSDFSGRRWETSARFVVLL